MHNNRSVHIDDFPVVAPKKQGSCIFNEHLSYCTLSVYSQLTAAAIELHDGGLYPEPTGSIRILCLSVHVLSV
jgi:hypothetical protein